MTISKINVNGQVYDVVDKSFEEKEEVISAALNDINSRIEEKEETISAALNDLNTRIVENEEVISASLNDLNQRISNGGSSLTLATVATSGSYNDLTNKPSLATVATTGSYNDLTNKPTLFSGSYKDLTNKPNLATVATTGSYNNLSNKPTIPAEQIQSDWNLTNKSSKDYIKNKPDLDKINQEILSIFDMLTINPEHVVDMGLPSGLLWSKYNIDVTQPDGFTESEYQYGCSFFSWGNTEAHNPRSTSAFGYDWGTSNDGPYASTPGAAIAYPGSADLSHDAARANCAAPWRLPTTEEFAELFENCDFVDANGTIISSTTTDKRITMSRITGIRLKSKINGKFLFFPCSGLGNGSSWYNRGSSGIYWSSSLGSATDGRVMGFYSGGVGPQNYQNRFYGFAVRPVRDGIVNALTKLEQRITALENNNNSN